MISPMSVKTDHTANAYWNDSDSADPGAGNIELMKMNNKDEEESEKKVRLKASLTLLNGITVIVGSIIGAGIFISPTGVQKNTGSVNMSLVVWLASGAFSMIGAYCYAELGCMISKTGADFAYIMMTFGRFLVFMRLWMKCIIVQPGTQAVVAMTFGIYVLKPFYEDCEPPTACVKLLAVCCITLLTFINCYSISWTTKVLDLFTCAKLLALALIIGTGIYMLIQGHVDHFTWENTETDFTKVALSFYSGLYAYNGWQSLNFIIEEMKNPTRDLPRAIGISIVLVTIVYMLTNVAFYTTLSAENLLSADAVALSFGNRHYGNFAWIIPLAVAMSTFGTLNAGMMTSSRVFYAGAREGQLPKILTMIQRSNLTPTPAVLFQSAIAIGFLFYPNVGDLIDSVSFATWLSSGVAVLCIPVLRYTHPELPRPIRVNLIWPVIYVLATLFITVLPIYADPRNTGIGMAIILTSVPVYFVFLAWKSKPSFMKKVSTSTTRLVQKFLLVVAED